MKNTPSQLFGENTLHPDLGQRSIRSGAVSITARGLNAVIQVGCVLVLARMLTPEDYGLVGMVAALIGFAPVLVSLGTPDIVIQRRCITENGVSGLFWTALAIAGVLMLALAAAGPLIARFYSEPRLTMLAVVAGLTFVASALQCQHYALLRRAMRFNEVAVIEVTANLLSAGLAILMAFKGFQYWALAARPVALNFFIAAGVWLRSKWIPRRFTRSSELQDVLRGGVNITGFAITDSFGRSADKIAVGYVSGANALGYYQNALFIYENLLDILTSPLHVVAIASLSKVVGDLKELKRLWSKALTTLEFYAMPAFGILAVTSEDIVALLLGPKWAHAGPLLSIMALRGIPHCVERTLGWLHVAAGRTDRWLRWGVVATCLQSLALLSGLPFGTRGIAIAYVACTFLVFIPAVAYGGQPLGIGAMDVIRASWRPLLASLAAVALGFALRYGALDGYSPVFRAAVLAAAFVLSYLLIVAGLLRLRAPLAVLLHFVQGCVPPPVARLIRMPHLVPPGPSK